LEVPDGATAILLLPMAANGEHRFKSFRFPRVKHFEELGTKGETETPVLVPAVTAKKKKIKENICCLSHSKIISDQPRSIENTD
jgi:hypothetical protein